MKRMLSLVLFVLLATFCFYQTAAAYSCIPHDNAIVEESYSGLTGNLLGDADTLFFNYIGFQMFQGFDSGKEKHALKHDFWGDHAMKHLNGWDSGSMISFRLFEGNNGEWSFLSLTFFSNLPPDDPRSEVLEEGLGLLFATLTEYFNGGDQDNPDPPSVPVPTPLLLLASGLVGFVGLRRMTKG